LKQLAKVMLPYPRSRHFAVTLDGIGGVGKSALALEFAHRHREHYMALPTDERFDAIVWVTAKRTLLTASGIQQRQQTFSTLADLYREIANVLEIPAILQVDMEQQRTLVERALSDQRTLLVIDNLETVDDEELLTFIRELPDPTKVVVTTRHRIDIAMPIRVLGMPYNDAHELMVTEAASKQIELTAEDMNSLFRRTAGVPLALVWSIALMSLGHGVEAVLRRLGSGHSDIARFCFIESIEHIRDRDAYRLLLALALFEGSVNRVMLGEVAGLGDDEIGRDDGLVELEQLSLINKERDRFSLLPLTRTFALEELKQQPTMEQELRERWIDYLVEGAQVYAIAEWRWRDLVWLRQEGSHFIQPFEWSQQNSRSDILLQVLPGVLSYNEVIGYWTSLLEAGQIGLDTARLLDDRDSLLYTMNFISWILSQRGQHHAAESIAIDGLRVAQEKGDPAWEIDFLQTYSQILRRTGRLDEALAHCEKGLKGVRDLPRSQQSFVQANIRYEMGKIARDQGDWQAARELFVAARSVFHEDDESPMFNLTRAWGLLSNLGFVAHHLGNVDEAAQMCEKALRFFAASGSVGDATTVRVRLAGVEADRGNTEAALTHAHQALEWSKRLGMVQERAQAEAIIARLEGKSSEPIR
jgi:LuxR family glucitol operon transcriptional activator